VDRHGSEKRPGAGTNQTGTKGLVSVKCGKFLGYLNEDIPKEGADKNIWAKDGIQQRETADSCTQRSFSYYNRCQI
jgi:hypothetical protein